MAIFRKKTDEARERELELLPSKRDPDPYLPVPDFSYSNDGLAQLIVDAWRDDDLRHALLEREADHVTVTPAASKLATDLVNKAGFNLQRAVVISEKEYYDHYTVPTGHSNEVVFVLPNHHRVHERPAGLTLLQTAKLLMATTPNGI
jgi:hypothetical protein